MSAQSLFLTEAGDRYSISITDVNQGWLGDCYFCATLKEIAYYHPDQIKNIVQDNGNGTSTVHLFQTIPGSSNWVTVNYPDGSSQSFNQPNYTPTTYVINNADAVAHASVNGGGQATSNGVQEIWPQIIEAAFAQQNGGWNNIQGGTGLIAEEQLTGAQMIGSSALFSFTSSGNPTASTLKGWIAQGGLVVGDTGVDNNTYGTVGGHAYAFTGITTVGGVDYANFANPWGYHDPAPIPVSELHNVFSLLDVTAYTSQPIAKLSDSHTSIALTDSHNAHYTIGSLSGGSENFYGSQTGLSNLVTQSVGVDGVHTLSTPQWNDVAKVNVHDDGGSSWATNAFMEADFSLSGAQNGNLLLTNAKRGVIDLSHDGNYHVTINAHSNGADPVVGGVQQHLNDFVFTTGKGEDVITVNGDHALSNVVLTTGSGHTVLQAANTGGSNTISFGSGRAEITGGHGTDNYLYHANSGVDVIQNFDSAHDTITLDHSLQSSMRVSQGAEGTTLMFGSTAHELVLHAISNFDQTTIHWS